MTRRTLINIRDDNKAFKKESIETLRSLKKNLDEATKKLSAKNQVLKELRLRNLELEQGYLNIDEIAPTDKKYIKHIVLNIQQLHILCINPEVMIHIPHLEAIKIEPLEIPINTISRKRKPISLTPPVNTSSSKIIKIEMMRIFQNSRK